VTIAHYLKTVEKDLAAGYATEHTHRPALKSLIESLAQGITATNEPKRIKCGAPDFIVTHGQTPLGYIEAKDIGIPLDREEKSEQMSRYLGSLDNLILTDYLEFRWYVRGEHRLTSRLATTKGKGKMRVLDSGADEVTELLTAFLTTKVPTVNSPKELAERMAAVAQLIRSAIRRAFDEESKTDDQLDPLHDQLQGFRDVLIHDLTQEQFADMYAQTAAYGLFAAKCNAKGNAAFTREHAAYDLPKTNPFLRKLFNQIAGPELDERVAWAVDDLAELLNRTDIDAILKDFGRRTRQEDPVVHFYETFLAAYDPKLRETRGVYYTPEPVVSYIVRSVDHILKKDFKLADGLADSGKVKVKTSNKDATIESHRVLLLDPATGTGTFLYAVINHIFETFKHNRGMWSGYVSEHLLPRLFGFELLMAPYAVAHLKLGLLLAETGYNFGVDERLRVYLTNTLEEVHQLADASAFTRWLTEEADSAQKIKRGAPVMVVFGNPPYSGQSANTGKWIANLLHGRDTQTGTKAGSYFEMDGQPLGEKNSKWLNDDYVKFIRFAQWRIEQTGYGVLAFITNHGYLDNPTFRGMRQSLMETFDDIYVLDLHGNSKKKERSPDGSKDENVFDIQQGVAIGLFIKRASVKKNPATVRHAHLWGMREMYDEDASNERNLSGGKYHWLLQHDVSTTEWASLEPQSPHYLFVPQNSDTRAEYEKGWKVTDIMPINTTGITTARDNLTVHWSREEVWSTVKDFAALEPEEARLKYELGKDARDWQVTLAQKDLKLSGPSKGNIVPVTYKPFDLRYTYYTGHSKGFQCMPRGEVTRHVIAGDNECLIFTRSGSSGKPFNHIFATQHPVLVRLFPDAACVAYFSPLYIYPTDIKTTLFADHEINGNTKERSPNLAPEFIAEFSERLGMTFKTDDVGDKVTNFGPKDVFNYMYAVFHSPTYRSRYAEFLKSDFARLPLTSNANLFRALSDLGAELVALHLLKKNAPASTTFPITGSQTVEAVRYTEPSQESEQSRVWINPEQYFEGVTPAVWNFHIGGYQVASKWLKDRKGRKLTYDELAHYQQVIAALTETINLMDKIDAVIMEMSEWPIK
jgi:predicted helicase